MSLLKGKYIENGAIDGTKIKLKNNETLKGRNQAYTLDVDLIKVNASDLIELGGEAYIGSDKVLHAGDKGIANGVASLDANGFVPANQLPSYVDDVLEFADLPSFPVTGETGKIYLAIDTGKTYRWSGSVYVEISPSDVNSVNSQTGAVVLDTDDISEGAANFYYTSARFDASLATKSTSDLTEGSNLYFTEARVRSTPLTGFVVGADADIAATDTVLEAFQKVQGQINALSSASVNAEVESITVAAGDITNGYVVLANSPTKILSVSPKGGLVADPATDYSLSTNQLSWSGDLASVIAAGDVLIISYVY